ncbi:SH3 domain-containing protein [Deinococcus reticulitermitis]|uniref:SH3 domain-containing protein n=1 Tax=Deinococcus reticulitermitis TaxID=856736 RepID=A0A1H6SQN4_9DEIO|nr:SH3 domain-containing protein [Deinococcus reticulitermitis]
MRKLILLLTLGASSSAYAATFTTTANLTLRSGPSASAKKLGVIPQSTQLTMACSGSWCRTTYQGQSGYVAKAYTKAVSTTTTLLAPALPTQKSRNVYYANCTAARAAGAAPIYAGEPGYRSRLDRDNDGVACE